ncbi:MAG: hypothetical protein HYX99_01340, partial [Chloroflexi bacterium]|nr:hypothetical protein [Chloroflexota bacterium]
TGRAASQRPAASRDSHNSFAFALTDTSPEYGREIPLALRRATFLDNRTLRGIVAHPAGHFHLSRMWVECVILKESFRGRTTEESVPGRGLLWW